MGDGFYDRVILPNLDELTESLRVDTIQQTLLQKKLITQADDQALRAQQTKRERAAHFLNDLLPNWGKDDYKTFCDILVQSAHDCPAHRKLVTLLGLSLKPLSEGRNEENTILDAEMTSKEVKARASKGAAGMFAIRVPSTASPQVLEHAFDAGRQVALHGLSKGVSSTVAESSGGAAGSLAAIEVYDPRFEAHGPRRDSQDNSASVHDSSVEGKGPSDSNSSRSTEYDEQFPTSDCSTAVSLDAGSQQHASTSKCTEETVSRSHQKTDRMEIAKSYFHDDIRQSGKCLIVFGSKARPRVVSRLDFATSECTKESSACRYLDENGGRHSCGTTVTDNEMYIVGGSSGSLSQCSTLVYNPRTGSIVRKSWPKMARSSCGVGMLDGLMVAVGGCNERKYLDSVEIWHPGNDVDGDDPSLRLRCPRANAAVVSVGNRLYCIGGYDGEFALNRVSILNKSKRTLRWTTGPQMAVSRRDLAAVVLENSIYAIGGRDASVPKDTVERHDPREKEWKTVTNLCTPRYGHSAVVISGKICVIGGDGSPNSLCIAVYDQRRCSWDEPLSYTSSHDKLYRLPVECSFSSVGVFDI